MTLVCSVCIQDDSLVFALRRWNKTWSFRLSFRSVTQVVHSDVHTGFSRSQMRSVNHLDDYSREKVNRPRSIQIPDFTIKAQLDSSLLSPFPPSSTSLLSLPNWSFSLDFLRFKYCYFFTYLFALNVLTHHAQQLHFVSTSRHSSTFETYQSYSISSFTCKPYAFAVNGQRQVYAEVGPHGTEVVTSSPVRAKREQGVHSYDYMTSEEASSPLKESELLPILFTSLCS